MFKRSNPLRPTDFLAAADDTRAGDVVPSDDLVSSYDAGFREAEEAGGSLYGVFTPMLKAAHERRIELLDGLPLGDLSNKVCVDYGVGSWGFACIFPKLQHCAYAIGMDISAEALRASERLSTTQSFPYGDRVMYMLSRGTDLRLKTGSVDLLFAGEAIEHVDDTRAFVDEVHRVLKPRGQFILTTPNADAILYRARGERAAVGPEHVALMSYDELRGYLAPAFEIEEAIGYNFTLHRSLDETITDPTFARAWAAEYRDRPDLAAGVILVCRARQDYRPVSCQHTFYHHTSDQFRWQGAWQTVNLHRTMTGRLGDARAGVRAELPFVGTGLILQFWTHDWSGTARVTIDGRHERQCSLYSPVGGFMRVVIDDLPDGPHTLVIEGTQEVESRSHGSELILHQAIARRII